MTTYKRHPINGSLWAEFFVTGFINNKAFEECIENSFFFLDEKKPVWVKLYNYRDLNEDKFEEFSNTVINQFNSGQIKEKFELVQITGILCALSHEGIIDYKIGKIIKSAKRQLIEINETVGLASNYLFPGNFSHGLKFAGSFIEEFKDFLKFARQQEDLLIEGELKPKAKMLFELMMSNFDQFQEEINDQDNESQIFQLPILKELAISEIVSWFKSNRINYLAKLSVILYARYDTSERIKGKLISELDWLLNLREEILNYQNESGHFVKFRIEKDVLPNLNEGIKLLKEVSDREALQSRLK